MHRSRVLLLSLLLALPAAVAPAGAEPVRSDESLDLRWFDWDDLPADISPELPQLIAAARARLGA